MRVNTVICEYNPFHNGHLYHIQDIKFHSNNPVVAVMSGNFTQRGDFALIDKFARAESAVRNGVDLVIELPTVYACASAGTFARAGEEIAEALGCADKLCFGAECSESALLKKTASRFFAPEFREKLISQMKSGEYYPRAVEKVMRELYSDEEADVVSKPNNILAIEYINALKDSGIDFYVTERKGAAHDEKSASGNITSASYIRELLADGKNFESFVPSYNSADFKSTADINRLERVILYKLRSMSREEFAQLPDVSEGLENRLFDAAKASCSLSEFLETAKTKRYTMARLRRIVICALLSITADMTSFAVPYLRVLAFNENGAGIMKEIKKHGRLPLITNVADGYSALDYQAKRIFDVDLFASDIYSLATDMVKPCGEDFTRKIKPTT